LSCGTRNPALHPDHALQANDLRPKKISNCRKRVSHCDRSPDSRQAKPARKYLLARIGNIGSARRPPGVARYSPRSCPDGFPLGPRANGIQSVHRQLAARIIARMPALIASDSLGHASTTVAKPGSSGASRAPSAPHSAPLWSETPVFPGFFGGSSSPRTPTRL
jgi:hypothetical protein